MRIKQYERDKAVSYAHKWSYGRNPAFYDFSAIGGDCTNFASQVIYSGSGIMNYTPATGWYYKNANNRNPSWTGVQFLYNFLTGNRGIGPFASETDISKADPGDIVQLSFDGNTFSHSPVIVSVGPAGDTCNILVAAHTFDTDYRPLWLYIPQAAAYSY